MHCGLQLHERFQTTSTLAILIVKYYGRLLVWTAARSLLPVFDSSVRARRVHNCMKHHVARDPAGNHRCVCCFKFQHEIAAHQSGVCSGLHVSSPHAIMCLGSGLFCSKCAAYSFSRTCKLADNCTGFPRDAVMKYRRARMCSGRHPVKGTWIGNPTPIEDVWGAFVVDLGRGRFSFLFLFPFFVARFFAARLDRCAPHR